MSWRLFDTHCHVQFPDYDADRVAVVRRAAAAEIGLLAVGTDLSSSAAAVALAAKEKNVWAVVGQHPSSETVFLETDWEKLARAPRVVGIGEIGLDFHYASPADREKTKAAQTELFVQQLRLAQVVNLPVVVHARDAHQEVLSILRQEVAAGRLARRGVMHCFTGTPQEAQEYLALGFYISFPGIVTFPPRKGETENALWPTVRCVPRDRILVETDAPWLAPVPNRGKRNEPAWVEETALALAKIFATTPEDFFAQIVANTCQLFAV